MPRYSAALLEAIPRAGAEWESMRLAQRAAVLSDAEVKPSALLDWATRYRRIDGRPFSLDRFAPLRAVYADDSPRIVVMKPAQRGASEWAINYALFALDRGAAVWTNGDKDGLNVGYIFPTASALSAFSKERISGLKQESLELERLFADDDWDTIDFKQVGASYLYLRGGWSDTGLLSFAADVLILDEYDRMAASAIALARRRLNASEVRRELMISTPTLPGVGVHALYLQSDRHVYETYHACGAWVTFDFFRDVTVDTVAYDAGGGRSGWSTWPAEAIRRARVELVCPACRDAVADDERRGPGRWRSEQPEVSSLRGYWVPWWPFPVVDLTEYACTAVSGDPSEITELFRSDLGSPYESSGSRLTREMIAALSHELPGGTLPSLSYRATTMGIDVGARFHYRVSSVAGDGRGSVYVRDAGSVASWDELDGIVRRFNVRMCVIDAYPEEHAARAFADRYHGRAVTATYPTSNALKGIVFAPESERAVESGRVTINRTMAMDAVYSAIASGRERWPSQLTTDPEVIEHLTAPVRVETTDPHGQVRADWVHTRPDHLYHASVYDTVARLMLASAKAPGLPLMQGVVRGW